MMTSTVIQAEEEKEQRVWRAYTKQRERRQAQGNLKPMHSALRKRFSITGQESREGQICSFSNAPVYINPRVQGVE